MPSIKDLFQSADWKTEKHVPVIECAASVKKGEPIEITVSVGKEIAHPNTTEHHINFIEVYFLAKDEKFPQLLGKFDFCAHGASVKGANFSTIFTAPKVSFSFKTDNGGVILANSYCNIHGLWESSKELSVI
jgi:superoxide reductase